MLNSQQQQSTQSSVTTTATTMGTINNPSGQPGTIGQAAQAQLMNQIPIAQATPAYSYYQQTAAMYPSPYSYMTTAVAATSATSVYPTTVIHQQQQQQQQQTIPVSVAPTTVTDPYAVYAAQLAQYQAYQQQMQQYAAVVAATSATPTVTPTIVAANPMIPFQQPTMAFQPTLMPPGHSFYPQPAAVTATTPIGMMPTAVHTTTLQPQILPATTCVVATTPTVTPNVVSSNNSTTIMTADMNAIVNSQKLSKKPETGLDIVKKSNYFCETCKLVCSSAESMMRHVTGFKHKKRLEYLQGNGIKKLVANDPNVSESSDSKKSNPRGPTMMSIILKCRICDVPCVSVDSYSSHIQGQRHNRSIAYRKKMGEPVYDNAPEILSKNVPIELEMKIKKLFADNSSRQGEQNKVDRMKSGQKFGEPSGMDRMMMVEKSSSSSTPTPPPPQPSNMKNEIKDFFDCKPIGQDFIEEVLNQNGKIVCYTCTLCECRFNDANAKNLHLKGRRHRLQYKKKVDPSLIVEFIKSDMIKIENEQLEKLRQKERSMKKILHTKPYLTEDLDPFQSVDKSKEFASLFKYNQNNAHTTSIHSTYKGNEYTRSFSDYLLEYRHHLIQPSKLELEYIYQTAYLVEKAIRSVGRFIELNFLLPIPVPKFISIHKTLLPMDTINDMLENGENRLIQTDSRLVEFIRVLRPGPLGKGLLLTGERYFKLIILSSVLPTESLLTLFQRLVPKEIERLSKNPNDYPGEYHVQSEMMKDKTKFRITLYTFALHSASGSSNTNEPMILDDSKKILRFDCYLTCPYIRDENEEELRENVPDLLNQEKCLRSLNDIRRYRWFKDMGIKHNFFTFTLRILRELTKRIKIWSHVSLWTFEVILERILISANCCLGPASLFRHFFEFLAHGILMTRGQGLADPCEARLVNIFNYLSRQDREDIMCSAQHLVRLVALRQLDKVLNVDSKIVYQIRMNEMKQLSNIQSRQSSNLSSHQSTSTFHENPYRYKTKPNFDRQKSSTTTIGDIKNTQQQQLQQQQQKSDDKIERNVSLKRKLSTDDTFEEPDLE
nr:zinc finger RNA-binding protein-like [Dermatophagoides farinae]